MKRDACTMCDGTGRVKTGMCICGEPMGEYSEQFTAHEGHAQKERTRLCECQMPPPKTEDATLAENLQKLIAELEAEIPADERVCINPCGPARNDLRRTVVKRLREMLAEENARAEREADY